MIRTIDDDPSNRSAGILAAKRDLVPMGADDSGSRDSDSCESPDPSIVSPDPVDWHTAMKRAIRSNSELLRVLGLAERQANDSALPNDHESDFPTFVPLEFLSRIRPGDPNDPLLRQVMVVPEEQLQRDEFVSDPVGDLDSKSASAVIHKYHGRALLISTGACGVHCRYCFRREFPYGDVGSVAKSWAPAIEYLRTQTDTDEVILSGGDPLTLVDSTLFGLIGELEAIKQLQRLRIHTRMPVVIPQRVTERLVSRLRESRLAAWIVIHANHPRELDAHVLRRVGMFIDAGTPVLNQAVLLRGVNDDADSLEELCRVLVNHRIQPYYLHQLDRVRGAAHFEVPEKMGLELMSELRNRLPGYAVPKYVEEREDAGEPSKTTLQG